MEEKAAVMEEKSSNGGFEPLILTFCCYWCAYAGADLAGTSRKKYLPNVRVVRVMCSGRIEPMFILKAFAEGADGVIVSGCHPNDCHYTSGNYHARRRWMVFRDLLDFVGIDLRRVTFSWVSAAEGAKWAELVNQATDTVRAIKAGAEDFLSKPAPKKVLLEAIERALQHYDKTHARDVRLRAFRKCYSALTPRERQDAIATLSEQGRLREWSEVSRGRPGLWYGAT